MAWEISISWWQTRFLAFEEGKNIKAQQRGKTQ